MSHFLKKLELNGFKSFAGKTVLEFPAGIVGVVGPNGSGKSNIVDAFRWLLGERDAKNLRGGKGEDLIFAGTQKRARVGVAQASLYFDNHNKFFPVDFEEVVVSREIRRDGQSKYFLNKSEILLRDLIDFFAKVRLGSRGLIIIGQGDGDMFIRATPLERREMIEEILGLREYQIKKADAERRLKNSTINLDKVTALIEEIVPHLRSLKRQTGRWERRGALEEELRALEQQFFGWQLHELREKGAGIDARIAAHQKQFEALAKEKTAAAARQASVEESQPEERKRLAAVKAEIAALMESRNKLQKDLGRIEAQVEMAKRPAPSASADRSTEHLLDIIRKVKTELESVLNEEPLAVLAAIESALEELNFALEEEEGGGSRGATHEQARTIPEPLLRDLERAANDIKDLEKNIAALREQERGLEAGQEGFYATFKGAVGDVQAAQAKIDLWEKGNRDLLLEKERIELRHDDVLHQIEQAGRRAEDFREAAAGATAAASADFAEMERRMFRLRGDLASIGEVDRALMQEADETEKRHDFLLKESNDLTKAIGDLNALMQELTDKITSEFDKSLGKINAEFEKFFGLMFDGGTARFKVLEQKGRREEGEDGEEGKKDEGRESEGSPLEDMIALQQRPGGIEIEIKLPRKKTTSLDMLSGGERSLVGIAALFAIVSVSPPPFLVLDETDAPLDERNARRFGTMLKDFSKHTQFIVVTHNRATMEAADILYGVTLAEDGSSKVISLKLEPEGEATALPS
ncbi:MAG: AAA family ATPase [Candidatus Pacebacteria bacterium]|nr:AAA family ATPase [Candidatus Paceibacterota bacterium]